MTKKNDNIMGELLGTMILAPFQIAWLVFTALLESCLTIGMFTLCLPVGMLIGLLVLLALLA